MRLRVEDIVGEADKSCLTILQTGKRAEQSINRLLRRFRCMQPTSR